MFRVGRSAMNRSALIQLLSDPRDPEDVLSSLGAEELGELLDALFQNLDTPEPEFGAQAWYEMAVEESTRRTLQQDNAAHGVA